MSYVWLMRRLQLGEERERGEDQLVGDMVQMDTGKRLSLVSESCK